MLPISTSLTGLRSLPVLIAIWLFGSVPVFGAEEVDTSNWQCQLCQSHYGWQYSIEAGTEYVSDDAYKFGDFTDLGDSGFNFFGEVHASYWGEDAKHFKLDGYRLGVDARAVYLEGGKQGSYKLDAFYRGVPRRFYDTGATPFSGSGSDRLTLPAGWVRAGSTQAMTALNSSLRPVEIYRDWDIYGAGLKLTPTTNWTVKTDYKYTEREGKQDETASFGFSALQFISPIDYNTHDLTAGADYSGDGWQLGLHYLASIFDNRNSSVTFDNPYTRGDPITGADTGRYGLAPDNWTQQIALTGSKIFPRQTVVTARLGYEYMKQDESLLPFTSNASFFRPLPSSSADARVENLSANLRATSSPFKNFTVKGTFRYRERNNKTDYVRTDDRAGGVVSNVAYDFERYDLKLGSEYRFNSKVRLHAGYDYQKYNRTQQERSSTNTDRLWGKLKLRINRNANLDTELYGEWRDGSSYTQLSNENPLMRRYNLADRDRYGVKLFGSLMVGDRADLGLDFEYADDDYTDSEIGLTDASFIRLGVNGTYILSRNASIYASVYGEDYDSDIANNDDGVSPPNWFADSDDTFYTGTIGLKFPEITDRIGASIDYTYSTSNGEIDNDTAGDLTSFPDLETDRHTLKLNMDYRYSKNLTYKFSYWYEDFGSEDWTLQGVESDTVSSLLSLGNDPNDYDAHVFYFGVRYEYGAD